MAGLHAYGGRCCGAKMFIGRSDRPRAAMRRAAFTMIEIILVVMLLAIIGGLVAVNYGGAGRWQALDESVDQFETAVRLAQADAASLGKRLRFEFDPTAGTCKVLIESLPLTQPNVFEEYAGCSWSQYLPGENCQVAACTFTGPSAFQTLSFGQQGQSDTTGATAAGQPAGSQGQSFSPITFQADGSCDSATVELVSKSSQDERRAVIEIDGLNGTINSRILTPAEVEEYRQQQEASQ